MYGYLSVKYELYFVTSLVQCCCPQPLSETPSLILQAREAGEEAHSVFDGRSSNPFGKLHCEPMKHLHYLFGLISPNSFAFQNH